jgi:hypothetical protein
VIAKPAHARSCPAIAAAGLLAGAVENGGNRLIRHLTRQHRYEFHHIRVGAPAMLAGAVLADPQSRMVAALPADYQV